MNSDKRTKIELGDFQTPKDLAEQVCAVIAQNGVSPRSIVEPTCGTGTFLATALERFPSATHLVGIDRNEEYVQRAQFALNGDYDGKTIEIHQGDFFNTDWSELIGRLPKPMLVLGNPPWVTNSVQGVLGGTNLPRKANSDSLRGIEAITGKSNFDISEWMIRQNLQWFGDSPGMLAVLCKTTVARKVLYHAWSNHFPIASTELRRIDAKQYFGVAVDACLLIIRVRPGTTSLECSVYDSLEARIPQSIFGLRENRLVADVGLFEQWRELLGHGLSGWRSGIKHDCSSVFELTTNGPDYENERGEKVDIEEKVLFPLLKSSDLARHRQPQKRLIIPQKAMTESPELLQYSAPKAWAYLASNALALSKRGSSIYRNRPPFSIFGVGAYSFSPWKVGISGLYKKLDFVPIPPFRGRPVMLDDTCYFFPCATEEECFTLHKLVESKEAREFWLSLVFWDTKRPITANILNALDLKALACVIGVTSGTARILAERQLVSYTEEASQLLLFREEAEPYSS